MFKGTDAWAAKKPKPAAEEEEESEKEAAAEVKAASKAKAAVPAVIPLCRIKFPAHFPSFFLHAKGQVL